MISKVFLSTLAYNLSYDVLASVNIRRNMVCTAAEKEYSTLHYAKCKPQSMYSFFIPLSVKIL